MSINYHGIFKAIKNDIFLNIQEVNFYESLFVNFYMQLLGNVDLESEIYIKQGTVSQLSENSVMLYCIRF
jgi:hypothetical protein